MGCDHRLTLLFAFFVPELLDTETAVLHLQGFFEELERVGSAAVVLGQFLGDTDKDLGGVEECIRVIGVEFESEAVRGQRSVEDC